MVVRNFSSGANSRWPTSGDNCCRACCLILLRSPGTSLLTGAADAGLGAGSGAGSSDGSGEELSGTGSAAGVGSAGTSVTSLTGISVTGVDAVAAGAPGPSVRIYSPGNSELAGAAEEGEMTVSGAALVTAAASETSGRFSAPLADGAGAGSTVGALVAAASADGAKCV